MKTGPSSTLALRVIRGATVLRSVPLTRRPVLLGSRPGCDLPWPAPEFCVLWRESRGVWMQNLLALSVPCPILDSHILSTGDTRLELVVIGPGGPSPYNAERYRHQTAS